ARTGRNLEDAFTAVALDTPAPLGKELLTCVRRTEMGLDIASAVKDLPETTGVSTLAMLTSAISVNQETGGDLIQVLERLSAAVRDRLHFVSRQRSATISSRLVAGMMLLIPFFVIGFFVSRDVNYMNQLLSSESGRYSFWTGVVLQVLGALIVVRILRRTSRF
ncbi:MAG: type II secretion system F family protein, partial [Planctomycetaceae bacterium]